MKEYIVKEYETFPFKGARKTMPELIRCKDCKYRSDYTRYSCNKKIGYWMDDDFCSSGERKEE